MRIQTRLLTLSLMLSLPLGIAAKEIDAKSRLICAFSQASLCHDNQECIDGSADTVNLPLILKLDLGKKTIASTHLSGEHRSSTIMAVNTSKNNLVLQGVQEGSGWSMTIDKANGRMSVSSSLEDQGYIAFGVCTHS